MYIDHSRVRAVAAVIAAMPEHQELNFYSHKIGDKEVVAADMYPAIGHPSAVDFFFFVCVHQYGFWLADERGYTKPLIGTIDGKPAKGSDLLFKACMRALSDDPSVFAPTFLAGMSDDECAKLFSDDNGPIPFRDVEQRYDLTRAYGRSLRGRGFDPKDIVGGANFDDDPLVAFLEMLVRVTGLSGDPLHKKPRLLAMALANRPERFLHVTDDRSWKPIVDYHVMRVALRTGLVVLEGDEAVTNAARAWVDPDTEAGLRRLTYEAFDAVQRRSLRSLPAVDHAFWSARRYCPEMDAPKCDTCMFSKVCAKRTELFQPVFATTNY